MGKFTGKDHPLCKSCGIYHGRERPPGGFVKLGEHWFVNHYMGPEGFFGWLALSPVKHFNNIFEIDKNNEEILKDLGTQFKKLCEALRDYWKTTKYFKKDKDKIKKIYLALLAESINDKNDHDDIELYKKLKGKKELEKWHLHFHVIPRYKNLKEFEGWNIYKNQFKYKIDWKRKPNGERIERCEHINRWVEIKTIKEAKIKKLMSFLREEFKPRKNKPKR